MYLFAGRGKKKQATSGNYEYSWRLLGKSFFQIMGSRLDFGGYRVAAFSHAWSFLDFEVCWGFYV